MCFLLAKVSKIDYASTSLLDPLFVQNCARQLSKCLITLQVMHNAK